MTAQTALPPDLTDNSRAWCRADIENLRPWLIDLPDVCLDIVNAIDKKTDSITEVQLDDSSRAAGREALAGALHQLESGCGFAVLNRLPLENMSADQATLAAMFATDDAGLIVGIRKQPRAAQHAGQMHGQKREDGYLPAK